MAAALAAMAMAALAVPWGPQLCTGFLPLLHGIVVLLE